MIIEQPAIYLRWLYPRALWRMDRRERSVYLTFDDGPIPESTPFILQTLREADVKATFFMVGDNVRKYPELFQQIVDEGHLTGNHTHNHISGFRHSLRDYSYNVEKANAYIHSRFIRPPHGWMRLSQYAWLSRKYKVVMWDLVTRDYSKWMTADDIVNNVKRYARNGSIITFHDSLKSIEKLKTALPQSIQWLKEQGYAFKTFVCALLLFSSFTASAQSKWNATYQQYIDQYKDCAIEQMLKWKIPASITLAQGILESGAGRSELATKGNNHFGIKCHDWTGARVYHDDDLRGECFRAYRSAFESYEDHSKFLAKRGRYSALFKLKLTDYRGWANGLKAAGYATDPKYPERLIDIIQLYKLYEYDTARSYDKFMTQHTKDHQVGGQPLHQIKIYNKNYFVIARRGDTFPAIGFEIGISYKKIAKYNERDYNSPLQEGEVIWLKKKQKKAAKEYKDRRHYVRQGESMYSIAQKYGIRLKSLYKMNHLSPDYDLRIGDELKLR